jgi:hypothetical protein
MTEHEHTTSALSVETFRVIPDFPGYRVSDRGRVQSCWKRGGIVSLMTDEWSDRKLELTKPGYLMVGLVRDGKIYKRFVHVCVLEAFIGPCPEGMECRHLDGVKLNNHISNLQWGTKQENMADRKRHGHDPYRPGELNPLAKLTEEQVAEIRRLAAEGVPQKDIAPRFGVNPGTISQIVGGVIWSHSFTGCPTRRRSPVSFTRLSAEQVETVRQLIAEGRKQTDIAREFGVSPCTISSIKKGRNWKRTPDT